MSMSAHVSVEVRGQCLPLTLSTLYFGANLSVFQAPVLARLASPDNLLGLPKSAGIMDVHQLYVMLGMHPPVLMLEQSYFTTEPSPRSPKHEPFKTNMVGL